MVYGARLLGLDFALCPLPAVSSQGLYFHFLCLHIFIYKIERSRILISGIEGRIQWARSPCFQDQPSCMCPQSPCFPRLSIFCSLFRTIKFAILPGSFHHHIYILSYPSLTYQPSGSFPIFSSLFAAKCLRRNLYVYPSASHFLGDPLLEGFFFSLLLHQNCLRQVYQWPLYCQHHGNSPPQFYLICQMSCIWQG